MFRISSLLLIAILALVSTSCKKDEPNTPPSPVPGGSVTIWSPIDASSGQVFYHITDIEQRGSSQIWISSYNGSIPNPTSKISVFGENLNNPVILDSSNTHYLKSKVTSIGFNSLNNMFMGAQFTPTSSLSKEIIVESGGVYSNYHSPGGLEDDFENFYFNSEGLWFGSGNSGLINFNNSAFTAYDFQNSNIPYPGHIKDIVSINTQDFWICTISEIIRKTGPNYDVVIDNYNFSGMGEDSQGNLWLAGSENILYKFDGANMNEYPMPNPFTFQMGISDIVCDSYDNVWIASGGNSFGSGLFRFDGTTWTHYTTSTSSLQSNNITKLMVDDVGNLWIGSKDAGVVRLNKFGTNN